MTDWVRASTKWHAVKADVAPAEVLTRCGLTLSKADDATPEGEAPRCLKCRKAAAA